MKAAFVTLVLGALAQPLAAETLRLRSGEHTGFSRIVVERPDGQDWRFGRHPDGYALEVDGADHLTGLAEVFRKIPRTRLKDVLWKQEASRLVFVVDCICHATASDLDGRRLVLDFANGPAEEESPFETRLVTEKPSEPPALDSVLEFDVPPISLSVLPKATAPRSATPVPPDEPTRDTAIDGLRQELIAGLSEAMSEGLISPELLPSPDAKATGPGQQPAAATTGDMLRVRTQEASDRFHRGEVPDDGAQCKGPGIPDFQQSDDARLGDLRGTIFDAAGRVDPDAVFALAHYFIGQGFGAEAEQALDLLTERTARAQILATLARIVDDRPHRSTPAANQALFCPGDAIVWRALADTSLPKLDAQRLRALHLAFLRLPPALKSNFGPRLERKLFASGHAEEAAALRKYIQQTLSGPSSGDLIDADLALLEGKPDTARATLDEILFKGGPDAPHAVLRLADMTLESTNEPGDDLVELIAAFAFEYRGAPVGAALEQRMRRVLARKGRLSEALFVPQPDAGGPSPEEIEMLLSLGLKHQSDIEFARMLADRGPKLLDQATSIQLRDAITDRADVLGLASLLGTSATQVAPNAASTVVDREVSPTVDKSEPTQPTNYPELPRNGDLSALLAAAQATSDAAEIGARQMLSALSGDQ